MLTVGGVSWQGRVSFALNRTHACNVPLPLWMELDLALVVDRAVASMSIATEWLTLKAATSTTTPRLIMCVRILIFPCTFIHRPDEMFCRLLAFFLAGCRALHLWHGNEWMKVQGKFKMQAHIISGVVVDIAAFKVSHSIGPDIDTTALRAARARSSSIHRGNR